MIEIIQSKIKNDVIVTGLQSSSRLHMFNILKNDKSEYYLNIFKNFTMPDYIKNNDNLFDIYVVDNDDWWDNISAHFYDESTLWWLICYSNDVKNPFEEIYPGMILKIYKKIYYYEIIQELKRIYKL